MEFGAFIWSLGAPRPAGEHLIIWALGINFVIIAVSNNIDTGRARHSVRAVVCLAQSGAHGVTRPTIAPCANVNVIRYSRFPSRS